MKKEKGLIIFIPNPVNRDPRNTFSIHEQLVVAKIQMFGQICLIIPDGYTERAGMGSDGKSPSNTLTHVLSLT